MKSGTLYRGMRVGAAGLPKDKTARVHGDYHHGTGFESLVSPR